MSKKRPTYDEAYDEDEELLLDRKAKRKRERELERQRQQEQEQAAPQGPTDDTMVRIVAACQGGQWREASVICLNAIERYTNEGQPEMAEGVKTAFQKIDRSLRRQMIAAFIKESEKLLSNKE